MASENSCNMWVFREGRTTAGGKTVLDGLSSSLNRTTSCSSRSRDALVDALLRAGELECGLADQATPDALPAAEITNLVAAALLDLPGGESGLRKAPALLDTITAPASLNLSTAEGFAYYALHPLDFAEILDRVPLKSPEAAVV